MMILKVSDNLVYNCPMCPLNQRDSEIQCRAVFFNCPLKEISGKDELLEKISRIKSRCSSDTGFPWDDLTELEEFINDGKERN